MVDMAEHVHPARAAGRLAAEGAVAVAEIVRRAAAADAQAIERQANPRLEAVAHPTQDHIRIAAIARDDAVPRHARRPMLREPV